MEPKASIFLFRVLSCELEFSWSINLADPSTDTNVDRVFENRIFPSSGLKILGIHSNGIC